MGYDSYTKVSQIMATRLIEPVQNYSTRVLLAKYQETMHKNHAIAPAEKNGPIKGHFFGC